MPPKGKAVNLCLKSGIAEAVKSPRCVFRYTNVFSNSRNEIGAIRKLVYLRACFMSFFFSSGALISFATFTTYVLTGSYLTPQKVFTCIALFNVGRTVMTLSFPIGITLFNDGRVGLERMQVRGYFEFTFTKIITIKANSRRECLSGL